MATQSKNSAPLGRAPRALDLVHGVGDGRRGGIDGGRGPGRHDLRGRADGHFGGERDAALRVDPERDAELVAFVGLDADDVVQEERQRVLPIELLARRLGVILERVDGRATRSW